MLERAKPDLIQQPSSWLLHNIAVQSCYFIIPWQHVLSCIKLVIYQDGSNNVVQVCSFIKPWTIWTSLSTTLFKLAMFKLDQLNHVEACQQPCSNWPAQSCSSLSTTMFKPVNNHVQTSQLNHVEACQQAKTICAFYVWYMSKKNIEIESTVRTKVLKGLLQIAVSCPHCDAEKELSLSYLFLSPESMSYQSWKRGFVKYRRLSRLINRILGKVFFIFRVWQPTCNRFLRFASFNK